MSRAISGLFWVAIVLALAYLLVPEFGLYVRFML